jgi:phospholipid/cholesterol/gamma-HCH transport system permease protein
MKSSGASRENWFARKAINIGSSTIAAFSLIGGMTLLLWDATAWVFKWIFVPKVRVSWSHIFNQMVRVGVRSVPIVLLVQLFIGIILSLQMEPTLANYGQSDKVANVIGVAVFRELGPLISAVVLSGFAGASIAAELGTMVTSEEIEALEAHALNPVRFLIVPRIIATSLMLICLTVLADVVGVFGGFATSVLALDISPYLYKSNTLDALKNRDFITGLIKAGVFGVLVSLIASFQGLNVKPWEGSEGVGRATTQTVVRCIVGLVAADCIFTVIFYAYGV